MFLRNWSLSPIRLALLVMGLVAVASLLFVLIWMATITNRQARDQSIALTRSLVEDYVVGLEGNAEYLSHWTHQYYSVVNGIDEDIEYQIGQTVQTDALYDTIIITEADGTPLYAYFSDGEGSELARVDMGLVRYLHSELNALLPDTRALSSGILPFGDQAMLVSSARIQLSFDNNLEDYTFEELGITGFDIPAEQMPIAHFFDVLTAEEWSEIGALVHTEEIAFTPLGVAPDPGRANMPLIGMDGTSLGHVSWRAPRPGDAPLRQMMPVVATMVLIMAIISMLVGGWSTRQTAALLDAQRTARTDHLTGLLNRAGLDELASTSEFRASLNTGEVAVLYLDLNDFKALNDNEGHEAGDMALQITADRLRAAIRSTDAIARLGGDEFVCILRDTSPRKAAHFVASRISELTKSPIQIGPKAYIVRPSIGMSIAQPSVTWEFLLSQADAAMYYAKENNRIEPILYRSDMGQRDGRPLAPNVVDLRAVS